MNLIATPHTLYNLNQGQQEAADKLLEFLFSDEKEFIISGPAGVGKTYLMQYVIDTVLPRYHEMCQMVGLEPKYREVVMTATTNKAAEVLAKSTGRPTSTIHSHLRLIIRNDFSTGRTILQKKRDFIIHNDQIIFIDECSMVDSELWKTIQDSTKNCKIVYVGDKSQLAPVQEDLSPVYKHNSPMVELLEPMRNSGQPALMAVCQQLRETVETGVFKPIQIVPGVIDLLDNQQMQDEIENHFRNQTSKARILAYTNKRVMEYNYHIRQMRQLPKAYQAGELLVSNTAVHTRQGIIPVEADVEVVRNYGDDRIVVDKEHGVELEVNYLDVKTHLGMFYPKVPFATNTQHLQDLIKYYNRTKNWERKVFLQDQIADFRPRDAATVHKSQGSTYDTVFIDLGNISTCHISNQVARMLYVAFSRARSRVFLFGNLADKYGGLREP